MSDLMYVNRVLQMDLSAGELTELDWEGTELDPVLEV